jgi:phage terminase large subunit-like protein
MSRHARAIRFMQEYCPPPKGYGAGAPLRLADFQKGWLEEVLADGVNSAAMSVARGNGKSTFLAALGVWAVFDPDETGAPQVPVVATTMGQAVRSVYGVALGMINASDDLAGRCLVYSAIGATKVTVPSTGGEMFPVSNDVNGLQGLDPSLAICDELGFMPIDSWDSLLLASGKRPRSLVAGIGTPGLNQDNALWHLRRRVDEGRAIPGFCYREYAAPDRCDIADEAAWAEANPALAAGFMNVGALRTAVELSPEGHFRIFRLGQWVDGVEAWLGPDGRQIWDALGSASAFADGPVWVGVDVALVRDSTAVVAVQERPDGRWQAKATIWQPTPGQPVDVTDVMEAIRRLDKAHRLAAVAYDPRFFDVPAKMLEDEGLPMVEFPQSTERMTAAVGGLYVAIRRGELAHDGDPVFTAQILNAVARHNERGFTLAKAKSRGRIDAAVALAMALFLATRDPGEASTFNVW